MNKLKSRGAAGSGAAHPAAVGLALAAFIAAIYFAVFPDDLSRIADDVCRLAREAAAALGILPIAAGIVLELIGLAFVLCAVAALVAAATCSAAAAFRAKATKPGRAFFIAVSAAGFAALALCARLGVEAGIPGPGEDDPAGMLWVAFALGILVGLLLVCLAFDIFAEDEAPMRFMQRALCRAASLGDPEKPAIAGVVKKEEVDGGPYRGYVELVDLKTGRKSRGRERDAYGWASRMGRATQYQVAVGKRLGIEIEPFWTSADQADEILRDAQRNASESEGE